MTRAISPYLSVIVAARNDDHGGNMLGRMRLFLEGLADQCARHDLDVELILVEWNPPRDRPRLAQALPWPKNRKCFRARIIEVSPEIHSRFAHSDKLPLFQMIAKNAGIRRAHGRFILATNIDILFSEELAAFMAAGKLDPRCMYRVDRFDVSADIPLDASIPERLEHCKRNILRINRRDGTQNLKTGEYHRIYSPLHRFLVPTQRAVDWVRRKGGALNRLPLIRGMNYSTRDRIHTNACGDFTLIAKERWIELRGYSELEMYSFHLDSLLCYAAHHAGLREQVLEDPMRIYHIEHDSGWAPEKDKARALFDGLKARGVPRMSTQQLNDYVIQMRKVGRPVPFNEEGWGLADSTLPESQPYGSSK